MPGYDNEVLERQKVDAQIKRPSMYHVIFQNDDCTHAEFVVLVLNTVFGFDIASAYIIMKQIHVQGSGIVGTYARSEAYEKAELVDALKKEYNQPLVVEVEKAK